MGRINGRVALVTGAAGEPGRAHALRMAEEGADLIAVDAPVSGTRRRPPDGLEQTAEMIRAVGRRVVVSVADVRNQDEVDQAVQRGVEALGRLDIVCTGAPLTAGAPSWKLPEDAWQTTLDTTLSGAWRVLKAAIPVLLEADRGGAIVMTGSFAGLKGVPSLSHVSAAHAGLLGLTRSLSVELGPYMIRVNCILAGGTTAEPILNHAVYTIYRPSGPAPTLEAIARVNHEQSPLRAALMNPRDVSNAVLWLVSDEARYVSGTSLTVDAGWANK